MKIEFEENGIRRTIEPVTENLIFEKLNQLDSNGSPFLILERGKEGYIQCVGDRERCSVEVRFNLEIGFRHFVVGRKDVDDIWATIESKVGQIRVLKNEVLTINEAFELLASFFESGILPDFYNQRNVSKLFAKD